MDGVRGAHAAAYADAHTFPSDSKEHALAELPVCTANPLSRWTFWWMGDVIARPRLFAAPPGMQARPNAVRFMRLWDWASGGARASGRSRAGVLWTWVRVLLVFGAWPLAYSAVLELASNALQDKSTAYLGQMVGAMKRLGTSDNAALVYDAVFVACKLSGVSLLRKLLFNQALLQVGALAYRVRSAIFGGIFARSVRAPFFERSGDDGDTPAKGAPDAPPAIGGALNRLALDSGRVEVLVVHAHTFWSCPVRIAYGLRRAHWCLGTAALPGIAFILAAVASLAAVGMRIRVLRRRLAVLSDRRMQLTDEMLRAIRTVKADSLEGAVRERISAVRAAELRVILHLNVLVAFSAAFNFWAPGMALVISVAALLARQKDTLESSDVFPAMRAFQGLMIPMWILTTMVNRAIASGVSVRRLDAMLVSACVPDEGGPAVPGSCAVGADTNVPCENGADASGTVGGEAVDEPMPGTYSERDAAPLVIPLGDEGTLALIPGELVVVTGPLGCGKSRLLTLIAAHLCEGAHSSMHAQDERVSLEAIRPSGDQRVSQDERISQDERVSQETIRPSVVSVGVCPVPGWVRRGTVRENIVFDRPWDAQRYAAVLRMCALEAELPAGEHALSSVDAPDVVGPAADGPSREELTARLSGGQRQRVALARALYGRPDVLLVDNMMASLDPQVGAHVRRALCGVGLPGRNIRVVVSSDEAWLRAADRVVVLDAPSRAPSVRGSVPGDRVSPPRVRAAGTYAELLRARVLEPCADSQAPDAAECASEDESAPLVAGGPASPAAPGGVGAGVAQMSSLGQARVLFALSGGARPVALLFALVVACEVVKVWRDMLLRWRADRSAAELAHIPLRMGGGAASDFAALLAWTTLLHGAVMALTNVLSVGLCFRASQALHEDALGALLAAPLSAVEGVARGRLLNRLGRDLETVDHSLPERSIALMGTASSMLCALSVAAHTVPMLIAPLLVLLLVVLALQRRFSRAWRHMLRLSSATMAPPSALVAENLAPDARLQLATLGGRSAPWPSVGERLSPPPLSFACTRSGTAPGIVPSVFLRLFGASSLKASVNAPVNAPVNELRSAPVNAPGNALGSAPGSAPVNAPGSAPVNALGSAPVNAPGSAPGNVSGSASGNVSDSAFTSASNSPFTSAPRAVLTERMFAALDLHVVAAYLALMCRRWVSLRSEVLGTAYTLLVALAGCVRERLSAATSGMLLSQAQTAAEYVDLLMKQFAEMDTCLIAVERVAGYHASLGAEDACSPAGRRGPRRPSLYGVQRTSFDPHLLLSADPATVSVDPIESKTLDTRIAESVDPTTTKSVDPTSIESVDPTTKQSEYPTTTHLEDPTTTHLEDPTSIESADGHYPETLNALTMDTQSSRVLEVVGVSLWRQGAPAPQLHDVSLHVCTHERVALIGRTGAGKSTLLALVQRLAPPLHAGTVRVCGRAVNDIAPVSRIRGGDLVAGVLQHHGHGVLAALSRADGTPPTLREVLGSSQAFGAKATDAKGAKATDAKGAKTTDANGTNVTDADMWSVLEDVGLAETARAAGLGLDTALCLDEAARPPRRFRDPRDEHAGALVLSSGQAQLVVLARALLKRPRLLLLDEATSGIDDPEADIRLHASILRRCASSGIALLSVVHRPAVARLYDRVVVLGPCVYAAGDACQPTTVVSDSATTPDGRASV